MAHTLDFFTGRKNNVDGQERIGELNRIWYDPNTNTIRVSDGVTPGGVIVSGGGGGGGTGPRGYTGSQGIGYTGSQGEIGFVGSQGPQGVIGFVGSQGQLGYVGSQGNVGYTGSQGAGYIGSAGDLGYTGSAGANGTVGSQGLIGYTGSVGYSGSFGYTGSQSYTGSVGYSGSFGYTGSAGSYNQTLNTSSNVTFNTVAVSSNVAVGGAGSSAFGTGAQLYIDGTNHSRIDFSQNFADPVGRSTGTRILFVPGTGLGKLDTGIGMSTNTLWTSVQDPNYNVGWYAGDGAFGSTPISLMILSGSGNLTVKGSVSATTFAGTLTTAAQPNITSVGTLTGVTSNAVNAFIAGDAAISGVALQMPREGALRNLYNGSGNNMYFDVSIGGASQGQFQFRSSNAFTNVLTMSSTGVTFNTDATFTSRTPSLARTAFNSAIDTELTIDDYRWRITNSGGIYAQVISNTGGTKNSAWTAVAAISGSAVTQGGSTGILLPNNSWTTLYTFGSMASAGDTVTVTLQDKAQGRIYRVTFMRSDNGSTTGYNIIAERLL